MNNIPPDPGMDKCNHDSLDSSSFSFSGDLICTKCGQVLQNNSQLASEPLYLDKDHKYLGAAFAPSIIKLTHQERSEFCLLSLARKLITSFALKPSYETEAIDLLHRYWAAATATESKSKNKYGLTGNRLLVAAIFLLSRRDHLAVNLTILSASIDSTAQECGAFFDPLIRLDESLRSLAKVSDFVEKTVDALIKAIYETFGVIIIESNRHLLVKRTGIISTLLELEESGSSRSAECTALASSWIILAALLQDTKTIKIDSAVQSVCDSSTLSFKTVKLKYNTLIDKLLELAKQLLPSTFKIKITRPRSISLLLLNLDDILQHLD